MDLRPPFAFIRKNTWLHREIKGIPTMMDFGWGNGYVSLPAGHPWYSMDYSDIPVSINGRLTYGQMKGDRWVIGFDTGHYMDTLDHWTRERVSRHSKKLLRSAFKAKI